MRIRTIKPEFWRSDDIAALDIADRLLFIGLWSYVDDSGVGEDKLASICADLFAPDLEANAPEVFARVSRGLQTLAERGLIYRYAVDGRRYLFITNWKKHQRIDKPGKARHPGPDKAECPDSRNTPGTLPEHSRSVPEKTPAGTGEQGNRGTGDSAKAGNSVPAADALIELPAPDNIRHLPEPAQTTSQTLIGEWIDHRKQLTGTRPTGRVIGQLSKEIKNLLDEGQPYDDVRAGLQLWDTKSLHPSTLASCVDEARTPRRTTNRNQQHTNEVLTRALADAAAGTPNPFMTEDERRRAK